MKKHLLRLIIACLLALPHILLATHNRAGEILLKQTGPLTIEATVITYTKTSSTSADRDSVTIDWGDGRRTTVARTNGLPSKSGVPRGEELQNDIKKNIYIAVHTYTGFAPYYQVTMTDPNRNAGILNVNPPYSDNVQFSLATTFTFLSQQFQGINSTPILLQPPVDFGCVGQVFIHNPNAYDIDGDSLFYQLTEPRAAPGIRVPNYIYPNKITSNSSSINSLTLNEKTGELIWNTPQRPGEYNVTIMVIEFRQGTAIDTTLRDMQIEIRDNCKNVPPSIEGGRDICVVAGTLVEFKITAADSDNSPKLQKVALTALGGPFATKISAATFNVPKGYQNDPLTGVFRWQTTCEHVSNQYYNVVFKAVDNFLADTTGLATLKTIRIKVIAPAPEDMQVNSTKGIVRVTWENPYDCEDAADKYFYGFSVWRRENSNQFVPDTCMPTMENKGYQRIAFKYKTLNNNRYELVDNTAERGVTYCYRVQGEFAKLTLANNPYNLVEGLPSREVCVQLNRDIPLPLEVDVASTNVLNGEIDIRWNRPNARDLDTLFNRPPYRFELQHALSATGPYTTIYTQVANSFASAKDTFYKHQNINTLQQHFYKIAFYVNNEVTALGTSPSASSILLSISPTDKKNILSWVSKTPWTNSQYTIYRKNNLSNQFDSIGVSAQQTYEDMGLKNGQSYCYYIKSWGAYSIKGIRQPLINRSQELCAIPLDNVPPCPPKLGVANICNDNAINVSDTTINYLRWSDVRRSCTTGSDLAIYKVFFAKVKGQKLEEIATTRDTFYNHNKTMGLTGCYHIVAVDSIGNQSIVSNQVCADNCPIFEIPNTFTPNGDGQNDLFTPFKTARFIARIDMQIFNRWGTLVYQTQDPNIAWNGKNMGGDDVAEGVYFYNCKVYEQRVDGIQLSTDIRSGFIQVFR